MTACISTEETSALIVLQMKLNFIVNAKVLKPLLPQPTTQCHAGKTVLIQPHLGGREKKSVSSGEGEEGRREVGELEGCCVRFALCQLLPVDLQPPNRDTCNAKHDPTPSPLPLPLTPRRRRFPYQEAYVSDCLVRSIAIGTCTSFSCPHLPAPLPYRRLSGA